MSWRSRKQREITRWPSTASASKPFRWTGKLTEGNVVIIRTAWKTRDPEPAKIMRAEPKAPPPKQPSPRDSNVAGSPKPLAPRLLEPRPGAVLDNGKADGRSALGGQFKKRPIPEEKSLAAVREKLEQEWPKAEKQPWQELATAAYAIRLGRDTKDKPAEQYALFEDAMERAPAG